MRAKSRGAEVGMSDTATAVAAARGWAEHLLAREFLGPSDTIERAAHQVEQKWGVPASLIQRLRHRDVRDMLLSNWLALKRAYEAECERHEARLRHELRLAKEAGLSAADSTAVRAAEAALGLLADAEGGGAAARPALKGRRNSVT